MNDVKNLRNIYSLSRKQLSSLFGIPVRTVQSWELGDRACPVYVFRMMANLLSVYAASGKLAEIREDKSTIDAAE